MYICMYIQIHMHIHTYIHIYIYIFLNIHAQMLKYFICICAHTYVSTYMYIYIYRMTDKELLNIQMPIYIYICFMCTFMQIQLVRVCIIRCIYRCITHMSRYVHKVDRRLLTYLDKDVAGKFGRTQNGAREKQDTLRNIQVIYFL